MEEKKNNYEMVYERLAQDFLKLDPFVAAKASGCTYDSDRQVISIPFFNEIRELDCKTGRFLQMDDSQHSSEEKIVMINYLNRYPMYEGNALTGKWVPLKGVPGGGSLFDPAFQNLAIRPLTDCFGTNAELLRTAALKIGAEQVNMGHAAVLLHVLPYFPVTLVVWEGDEEVPASANVLYDENAHLFAHIEDVIGLGVIAVRKTVAACCDPVR